MSWGTYCSDRNPLPDEVRWYRTLDEIIADEAKKARKAAEEKRNAGYAAASEVARLAKLNRS